MEGSLNNKDADQTMLDAQAVYIDRSTPLFSYKGKSSSICLVSDEAHYLSSE